MAPISLQPRQTNTDTVLIPSTYGNLNNGPAPGTVVGIVLGSVAGFLLLLWLLYTCFNAGPGPSWGGRSDFTEEVVVKGRRKKGRSSSRRVSETVEIRAHERGPSPVPIRIVRQAAPAERTERIIVEERRESRRDMGGDDEVIVIEDHGPPRRNKSKRDGKRDSRH